MYCIVTGAAGFIGSNLVRALNREGVRKIIAVDDLTHGDKFRNLVDCEIADYMDRDAFLATIERGAFNGAITTVFHEGACSDTTESNGRYMMDNNYRYSRALLDFCVREKAPFLYASSAAVYGASGGFSEKQEHEKPLNVYGYSKLLFDQVLRLRWSELSTQVVGLRYFNVYGEREQHKGRMASVAYHFFQQYRSAGTVRLFEGSGGYADGEQRRDFVAVEDAVNVNLFFFRHPEKSGIFNVGTGAAQSFNDVAVAVVNTCRKAAGEAPLALEEMRAKGVIRYIAFPEELRGKYQSFTQADIAALRSAGYADRFLTVEEGVGGYCRKLMQAPRPF